MSATVAHKKGPSRGLFLLFWWLLALATQALHPNLTHKPPTTAVGNQLLLAFAGAGS